MDAMSLNGIKSAINDANDRLESIVSALVDIAEQTAYTYLIDTNNPDGASSLFRVHNATGKVESYSFRTKTWG